MYRRGRVILFIIIGDVHQFSAHCLIPLDPCEEKHFKYSGVQNVCVATHLAKI